LAAEFHCTYHSLVITNGLELSDSVAAELVRDLGVGQIQVTLDGLADRHDVRRPTKGGRGTFDRIFANAVSVARREDLGVQVIIRCNIDRRNADGVGGLIRALADARVLNRLWDFVMAPVHDWGNHAGLLALPKEEFAEREAGWLAELATLGFISPRLLPRREKVRCIAVTPHSFLVDPFGQLFSCTEASLIPAPPPQAAKPLGDHASPNGAVSLPVLSSSATYAIGDLTHGEQPGRRQPLGDFNARVGRGEYSCSTCRMLPVCGGACPKLWLEGSAPCPSAKFNIESRLLLGYAISRLNAHPANPMGGRVKAAAAI
jgi:uncharacterized protein